MSSKIIGISLCAFILEGQFIHAEERVEQERIEMERMSPERMQQEPFNRERFNQNREEQKKTPQRFEQEPVAQNSFSCPDLSGWKGESPYQGWTLIHTTQKPSSGEPRYAYDAWILPPESEYNMYPAYTAQCNYTTVKPGGEKPPQTKQIVFGKKINPTDYKFASSYYTRSKHPAHQKECSPWKKRIVSINHYPPECDFVPNTAGAYRNEKYQ